MYTSVNERGPLSPGWDPYTSSADVLTGSGLQCREEGPLGYGAAFEVTLSGADWPWPTTTQKPK